MSGLANRIEAAYQEAKSGRWKDVMALWADAPAVARRSSRFQKETSGWTFLHQAAYFGHEKACLELIRLGAAVSALSVTRESPAEVAEKHGHSNIVALLRRAHVDEESLWSAPSDPDVLPSSHAWNDATERRAAENLYVAYAGGTLEILRGSRYYVDAFERVLVGWHGTYDPPYGMDDMPLI
ncbi:ankyrin repeat domain-containing protein [Pseudomonas sp. Pseusp97]|uniref:ankyrin repeat domain-containing protein n=1 Tax=Pseudomonas sp. Pseusp97 TaxID=3243065 RepID=UPI0039A5E6AE